MSCHKFDHFSLLGSRIGRQPNSVKHQTLLELASIRGKEALTSPSATQSQVELCWHLPKVKNVLCSNSLLFQSLVFSFFDEIFRVVTPTIFHIWFDVKAILTFIEVPCHQTRFEKKLV